MAGVPMRLAPSGQGRLGHVGHNHGHSHGGGHQGHSHAGGGHGHQPHQGHMVLPQYTGQGQVIVSMGHHLPPHHHENYHPPHHHPHHHVPPPPPSHYQPPPPPYTTMPLSQILPPPSNLSPASSLTKEKTPMCLVNELARYNKVGHQYRLTDESGPAHKKNFLVCLKIGEAEEYTATGPSIKKAQHAAAAIALEKTQFKHPAPKAKNMKNANITPTVELNALAMKRGEPTTYTFLEQNQVRQSYGHQYSNTRQSGFPPMFYVQLRVGNRDFSGEGPTAQAAKHNAAGKALKMLNEMPIPDGKSKLDPTSQPFTPGIEYDDLKSPISLGTLLISGNTII